MGAESKALTMPELSEGAILAGKYRVDRVLGMGGMGVVIAATHVQLDEPVALKFMLPEAIADEVALQRFSREARAAVKLRSEHVARVLDVGTLESGAPYIVMEFLKGTDLASVLSERGPLPIAEAAEYVLQACEAIAEAHSLGIVHRDLKPANLFLTQRPDGSPLIKVLDFGISKAYFLEEAGLAITKTAAVVGSPFYMSPEQLKSAKNVDARSDIWSLGIILYELTGGRVPFDADTLGALVASVLTATPAPLDHVRPDIRPEFASLVTRCLEKEKEQRFGDVSELAQALAPFAPPLARPLADRITSILRVSRESLPRKDSPSTPPVARRTSFARARSILVLVAGFALAGGAAVGWSLNRGTAEDSATSSGGSVALAASHPPANDEAARPPAMEQSGVSDKTAASPIASTSASTSNGARPPPARSPPGPRRSPASSPLRRTVIRPPATPSIPSSNANHANDIFERN